MVPLEAYESAILFFPIYWYFPTWLSFTSSSFWSQVTESTEMSLSKKKRKRIDYKVTRVSQTLKVGNRSASQGSKSMILTNTRSCSRHSWLSSILLVFLPHKVWVVLGAQPSPTGPSGLGESLAQCPVLHLRGSNHWLPFLQIYVIRSIPCCIRK